MTPHPDRLSAPRSIDKGCTLRNNAQLLATMSGLVEFLVQEDKNTVEIHIDDVLRGPGRPCRLLGKKDIKRNGCDSVGSGRKKSKTPNRREVSGGSSWKGKVFF